MSLALARKYRPKNFASVAVQSHVSNTLKGAIARGRVAHGYLLCGPRGTGKTTLARVLAMALNCERRITAAGAAGGPDGGRDAGGSAAGATDTKSTRLPRDAGEPCGECASCRRIWSGGASLDVVEIDAASNRGVDDARELRERAMYAPSGEDRYKVYIVDEAHMLTREAWNALLKILEEPPPRVVFVFATTEPQKIAQTAAPILSRLQRFDLKRIGPLEIRERLAAVLAAEGVEAEPEALAMIARAADGGLRDALSLTDQVLSLGSESRVTADRVREALGLVAEDEYLAMLDLVAERRAGDVFAAVARLAEMGVDLAQFVAGLSGMLRAQLAVALGGAPPDVSDRAAQELVERRERLAAGDLLRMLTLLAELEPRFRKSAQQQLLLETLLVRFALLDRAVALEEVLRGLGGAGERSGGDRTAAEPRRQGGPPVADRVSAPSPRPPTAAATTMAPERTAPPAATARGAAATRVAPTVAPAVASAVAPTVTPTAAAPAAAASAAGAPVPDLNLLAERWDRVVAALRGAGRGVLATLVAQSAPVAVAASGAVTIEPEDAGTADPLDAAREEIAAALREQFAGVQRVIVRRPPPSSEPAGSRRVTHESVRSERVGSLRRKDPVLGAAIDALDLELLE